MNKFSIFNSSRSSGQVFKFSIIVWGILLFTSYFLHPVFAIEPPTEKGDYVYNFFLFYDTGQLFGNRDKEIKYEVVSGIFIEEDIKPPNDYRVDVINFKNQVVKTVKFDPQKGDPSFMSGAITVIVPYVANGNRVNFYNPANIHLLTIFVSESSFCDDNGSCDASKGEDSDNCPLDCRKSVKRTPIGLPPEMPETDDDTIKTILMYLVFAGAICAASWFSWKWWRGRNKISPSDKPNFFADGNNQNSSGDKQNIQNKLK